VVLKLEGAHVLYVMCNDKECGFEIVVIKEICSSIQCGKSSRVRSHMALWIDLFVMIECKV
jgi:hypothetical protein